MPLSRWELLLQGLALLAVIAQTSRVPEPMVDYAKQNRLITKISQSGIPVTEEDKQRMNEMTDGVFKGTDAADGPQTLLKTKFDPSPLGAEYDKPNPDQRPAVRDLRTKILKHELKLDKAELKGKLALEASKLL